MTKTELKTGINKISLDNISDETLRKFFYYKGFSEERTERAIKAYRKAKSVYRFSEKEIKDLGELKYLDLKTMEDKLRADILRYLKDIEKKKQTKVDNSIEEILIRYFTHKGYDTKKVTKAILSYNSYLDILSFSKDEIKEMGETKYFDLKAWGDGETEEIKKFCDKNKIFVEIEMEPILGITDNIISKEIEGTLNGLRKEKFNPGLGSYYHYITVLNTAIKNGAKYEDLKKIKPEDYGVVKGWIGCPESDQYSAILDVIIDHFGLERPNYLRTLPSLRLVAEKLEAPYSVIMDCFKYRQK